MNELRQLKFTLPMIHRNSQYSKLAKNIENAVREGRHSISQEFDMEIDDEAITALKDANISIMQASDGSYDYEFEF